MEGITLAESNSGVSEEGVGSIQGGETTSVRLRNSLEMLKAELPALLNAVYYQHSLLSQLSGSQRQLQSFYLDLILTEIMDTIGHLRDAEDLLNTLEGMKNR